MNAHRLVAMAWIGTPEGYARLQVCHNDGNRLNNHFSNLRWDTPKNNTHDKYAHGTAYLCKEAEEHHNAKLTKDIVVKLRIWAKTKNCKELSIEFKVPKLTIYDAVTGKTWKSVNSIESPVDLSGRQYTGNVSVRRVG